MQFMSTEDIVVENITVGDLMLVADPPSGRWFAAVKEYEDGHGVRTFTLFGSGKTVTLAWHQTWPVGR